MEELTFRKLGELYVSDSVEAGAEGKVWFEIDFDEVPVNIIVEATADEAKGTWARIYGQKYHYATWGEGVSEVPGGMVLRVVLSREPISAGYLAT